MIHWEKGISGRGKRLSGKHRGRKANDTVRELKAIPHRETGRDGKNLLMVRDEQGELTWGQIIKRSCLFSKEPGLSLFSFCFTVLSNIEENQKGTNPLFLDKGQRQGSEERIDFSTKDAETTEYPYAPPPMWIHNSDHIQNSTEINLRPKHKTSNYSRSRRKQEKLFVTLE